MAAAALARVFGAKKGEPPSPQVAILKLRETEEMLNKKSKYFEKKINGEAALAKKHSLKNKGVSKRCALLHTCTVCIYMFSKQNYTKC